MNIELLKHQKQFIATEAIHPAICGGYGSGKTKAATMRLLYLMFQDKGINTLLGMPTFDLIRLRAMPGVLEDLEAIGLTYMVNRSEFSIKIHGFGVIYFRSYDRPERWVSFEVSHCILDELDTLPRDKALRVWQKASERTRQKCSRPNTIGNVTTPDMGIHGFTYEKWVKKKQPGYELINASTYDNFYLPEGYTEQILANYDPVTADAYLRGMFVSFNRDKVYHFFDRKKHHTGRELTDIDKYIHIGLDFNIGGTCAVVFIIENNYPVAVDEFVSYDTNEFCTNLAKRYPDKHITIYPDASGHSRATNASGSDVAIITNSGYSVSSNKANPLVRDRINAVNGLLSQDHLLVNTDTCPELTNALESQGYTVKGEPEKFNDHPSIDDWCFSGDTQIAVNGKQISFKDIPECGEITAYDGGKVKFTNGGLKGYEELFEITHSNGIIRATGDHEFLTLNGWVPARYLTGETLCYTESYQANVRSLTAQNISLGQISIFTKLLGWFRKKSLGKVGRVCTELFTNFIMEKFQMDLWSIIKMKINRIIHFLTLNFNEIPITEDGILKNFTGGTLTTPKESCRRIKINAENGTGQLRARNGTGDIMPSISMCCIKKTPLFVRSVKTITKVDLTDQRISSVQEIARRKREEIAALMMRTENATYAGKSSQQTNTRQRNTAVKSVERLEGKEPVYCLRTSDGCFALSDGAIVSNCDSLGYFIHRKYGFNRLTSVGRIASAA